MFDDDTFTCALDAGVTAELNDNHDGAHVMVWLMNGSEEIGIALTADNAHRMAEVLLTLAAGMD